MHDQVGFQKIGSGMMYEWSMSRKSEPYLLIMMRSSDQIPVAIFP
jgi:hypothetical protein